jgi:hypothetical protein
MSPLTMRGHLQRCWLFTWRTPAEAARSLLPAPLELVTHGGFAFWNVVVCELRGVRPAPMPAAIGLGYWHIAYRLHTRVRVAPDETFEGLYFVRSDCDRRLVAFAGNLLTDFRFHCARIAVQASDDSVDGAIRTPGANARFRLRDETPGSLSPGSPFTSVAEAAAFLKYKPFALTPAGEDSVSIVRVVRRETDWRCRVVSVVESDWEFFNGHDVTPEVCYAVEPIEYEWRRAEFREVLR